MNAEEGFELLRAVAKRAQVTSIAGFKFFKGLHIQAATRAKLVAVNDTLSAEDRAALLAFCA